MTEMWADIAGYEGLYQVSSAGRVRSLDHKTHKHEWRGIVRVRAITGKVLSPMQDDGYHRILLWKSGKAKAHRVHRLVADAFIPKIEGKPFVNHKNGKRNDNRVDNLEWCTNKENVLHGFSKKAYNGEAHQAKLNQQQVVDIINALNNNSSLKELAIKYSVSKISIRNIKTGRTWRHVSREVNIPVQVNRFI